jgi:hypothetical protein
MSSKRLQISKANAFMFSVLVGASVIASFSLVTVRVLFSEMKFQQTVIGEKKKALNQLKQNFETAKQLEQQYAEFEKAPDNVIGGSSTGTGERDGSNAKIILDALPSKYDFPALATSLDGMVKNAGVNISNITGIDKEVEEYNKKSPKPEVQPMEFGMAVSGNYDATRNFVFDLERSIRPIKLTLLDMSGSDAAIRLRITAETYYQPEKDLTLTTKELKP